MSGIVYAAGTLGSLLGTFLATHVLVPFLGLVTTFVVAGGCLAAAAGLALVAGKARAAAWLLPVALLPGTLALLDEGKPIWLGEDRLLDQRDSAYQRLWVVESLVPVDGAVRRVRRLKINEGLDSFHSVWIEGSPFTDGAYYDAVAVLPLALGADGTVPESVRVLSLGCAAGSILRGLAAVCGERLQAVGVDLDPVVLELAQKWFEIDASRWALIGNIDARAYVERVDAPIDRFDVVYVDTYRSQIYLPPHLASVEFFRAVQRRLRPGGTIALNVGDLGPDGPVLGAVSRTLATVFAVTESVHIPGARNYLVVGHEGPAQRIATALQRATAPVGFPTHLFAHLQRPSAWRRWQPATASEILTDARSSLGPLHERMYARLPSAPR